MVRQGAVNAPLRLGGSNPSLPTKLLNKRGNVMQEKMFVELDELPFPHNEAERQIYRANWLKILEKYGVDDEELMIWFEQNTFLDS